MLGRGHRVAVGIALAFAGLSSLADIRSYACMIGIIAIGCAYEYSRMLEKINSAPFAVGLYGACAAYVILAACGALAHWEGAVLGVLIVYIAAAMLVCARTEHGGAVVARAGATVFGTLYIGKLLAYCLTVRLLPGGLQLSVVMIFIIAFTDIFAMLIGRKFGKTPLTRISPGKTVEGAAGGVIAAVISACALAAIFMRTGWLAQVAPPTLQSATGALPLNVAASGVAVNSPGGLLPNVHIMMSFGQGGSEFRAMLPILIATALVAVWTSIAAQSGDVLESALKRDVGVKDAGTVFAGHGGVFDRFDSYIGGGIAFYAALMLFGMPGTH